MKKTTLTLLALLSTSAFAQSSGGLGCTVSSVYAIDGDTDLYGKIKCSSGEISFIAKSEAVKSVLLAAQVSKKEINVSAGGNGLMTVYRVEME